MFDKETYIDEIDDEIAIVGEDTIERMHLLYQNSTMISLSDKSGREQIKRALEQGDLFKAAGLNPIYLYNSTDKTIMVSSEEHFIGLKPFN